MCSFSSEFLEKSVEIYRGLLQTLASPRDPVIVPTSGDRDTKVHALPHIATDGVDAMQFFRSIYPLLDRVEYRHEFIYFWISRQETMDLTIIFSFLKILTW